MEDGFHLIAVQHRFVLQYCDEDYKWKQEPEYTWNLVPFLQTLVDAVVLSQDTLEKKIVRIPEENRQEEKLRTT